MFRLAVVTVRFSVLCAVVALCLARCGGPSLPPSFILISLDTTRADHLGVYGYARDTTPFLDQLAQRAFVFEQAIAPSQNTLVSHASLLTGVSSTTHGARPRDGGRAIAPAFTTLAEDLAAHGYRTGAFLAHPDWLSARFGFDQGFGAFASEYVTAERVLRRARGWLSRLPPDSPYFLFVHLYDVHSDWGTRPYDAPSPFRGKFATRVFDSQGYRGSEFLGEVNLGNLSVTPKDVALLRDRYDEGLAYVDHELGVFFDSIDPKTLERTWIIVVADHGEGFLEHGRLLHATFHDEIVRVPLLVVPPPGANPLGSTPDRIAEQVRLIDIRPTVLSLAGLPAAEDAEGLDLTPCMRRRGACGRRPATLHTNGLRFEGFKLINGRQGWQLYDLEADPGERVNLVDRPEMRERKQHLRWMLKQLVDQERAMRERILLGATPTPMERDPAAEERLKSLGYAQ